MTLKASSSSCLLAATVAAVGSGSSTMDFPPPTLTSSSISAPVLRRVSTIGTTTTPSSSCTITPSSRKSKMPEKTGRWTEDEHQAFLQGLNQHGKQWKLIASMIGSRTVVQVRTHAQKYFQKLERKNNPNGGSATSASCMQAKRKSLPASLPSRKSKSAKSPKKPRISISLSNINAATLAASKATVPPPEPTASPLPMDTIPALPIYPSSSCENLATISPAGVADLDMGEFDEKLVASIDGDDALDLLLVGCTDEEGNSIMNHLPESSLPPFPDFSTAAAGYGGHEGGNNGNLSIHLQPQQSHPDDLDGVFPIVIEDIKVTAGSLLDDTTTISAEDPAMEVGVVY